MGVQEVVLWLDFAMAKEAFYLFFLQENIKALFQFSRHFEISEKDQLRKVSSSSS